MLSPFLFDPLESLLAMPIYAILQEHIPIAALNYCLHLTKSYRFKLELSFNRKSKFGHYRFLPATKTHVISINKGLPKPMFLLTFIHELAHMEVMLTHGRQVKPHGHHWKFAFTQMMLPLLNNEVFTAEVLAALRKHFKNPKASLSADPLLFNLLMPPSTPGQLTVGEVEEGATFIIKNRHFVKVKSRRTRALCYEPASQGNYLIPLHVSVNLPADGT